MPIYTFYCATCTITADVYRKLGDYEPEPCPRCGGATQHVIGAPAVIVWNGERRFPNLSPQGDGCMAFPSRAAYEEHLKAQGVTEIGVTAPIKRPHGNRVVKSI